ncbi:hypothetical protein ACYOEI_07385 [Singulisphaera rosea]
MKRLLVSHGRGLVGAVVGGVLGYKIFVWLADHQYYGLMIPGALLGLGCNVLSLHASRARGIACGIAAAVLSFYCEWVVAPFKIDDTFGYLVSHAYNLSPVTLVMIAAGTGFAFWLGKDGAGWFDPMGAWSRKSHSKTRFE